mmetsp:Transcript_24971/g.61536  ORF Transcript_24971/g.61536 Transcript_24971/m.61536 type:complete len:342 (+) Transcript_24971:689-1714(+)
MFSANASIASNSSWLICHSNSANGKVTTNTSYSKAVTARCKQTSDYLSNGDDAYALAWAAKVPASSSNIPEGAKVLDIIGYIGADPGDSFTACNDTMATLDSFIARKVPAKPNGGNWTMSAGTTAEDCEWIISHNESMTPYEWARPMPAMAPGPPPANTPAPVTPVTPVDPAAPTKVAAVTMALGGYTAATFTAVEKTAFTKGIADTVGVAVDKVKIVKVTDVAAAGRHLLQAGAGITVEFTVEVDSISNGEAAITKIKTASTSGALVTAFKSSGLAAVTTVDTTKSGVTEVAAPGPAPAPAPAVAPLEAVATASGGASTSTRTGAVVALAAIAFSMLSLF